MPKQLTLFYLPEETSSIVKVKTNNYQDSGNTIVYIYYLHDHGTNTYYIGVSKEPYARYQAYLSFKHNNPELKKAMKERPNDFEFVIVEEFKDTHYRRNNPDCISIQIESFYMDFYNSILNGYNVPRMFTHDYHDLEFWKGILPPKSLNFYLTSNLDLLNDRASETATKSYTCSNNKPTNIEIYNWCVDYLLELNVKGIKIYLFAKSISNIDRSNLYRFITGKNVKCLSESRVYNFIRDLEKELGLEKRPDPVLEITKI